VKRAIGMNSQSTVHTASASGASVNEAAEIDQSRELHADLVRLRALLERGDVEGARAWVKELERLWPEADEVTHYARVLAPPQVSIRHGHRGPSRRRERAWLREHARQFPGQSLAILEDQLIAADADLDTVLTAVRQTPGARRPLLHFQPGTPD
jgi:hypothetical protein